uniref:Uncharacterized protein n=1 Tax=Peromyscus maniculatus bairdii TaxID=230844 RepID=A0A8C8UF66_PERMB
MSSNDDPVAIPMIERNPSDFPGMDTSDPDTLTGEAVLSFHNISYRETVQSGFPFRKKTYVIGRLYNINGIMRPGLNAIMGPEDGSRSWLLDVLAARKDPRGLSGDILINGKPRPANFKCISGYVPQVSIGGFVILYFPCFCIRCSAYRFVVFPINYITEYNFSSAFHKILI